MADVRLIDANTLINVLCKKLRSIDNGRTMRQAAISVADGMRIMELEYCIGLIQCADIIDAVPVVRCSECKNGAPLPEEARDEFSPGVMRCLAGRGDCDKYCTTWEDGFCDEGAKLDAKDMDVPTKDGGAADGSD